MAKQSGIGSSLIVGAFDISGQIGALTACETRRATLDVTAINAAAPELIMGQKDGSMSFTSYWTGSTAGEAHVVLSAQPRTDVQMSALIGATVGSPAATLVAKQVGYAPSRGQDGSLVATTTANGSGYGLEWGELLTTGKQTFASGSINGTSIDYGAATTAFGATAYLHVISLGSGTPTVTIKDSADNGTFLVLSPTSLVFTGIAAGVQRVQTGTTATVRRYLRVEVTGTYTNLVCVVSVVRYLETP